MAGDTGMEDMVTEDMDTEDMVIIIMDTAVITTITTITMITITGERLLKARDCSSRDPQVMLTLFPLGLGLKDPPWQSLSSDCLEEITITTTPCTTDTATTTGDHVGSNYCSCFEAAAAIVTSYLFVKQK